MPLDTASGAEMPHPDMDTPSLASCRAHESPPPYPPGSRGPPGPLASSWRSRWCSIAPTCLPTLATRSWRPCSAWIFMS